MTQQSLAEHIARDWPGCTCPWQWGSHGILYGVGFMPGWSRTSTAADCPHHANWRPTEPGAGSSDTTAGGADG